jgi:hypothetical protein
LRICVTVFGLAVAAVDVRVAFGAGSLVGAGASPWTVQKRQPFRMELHKR